MRSRKLSENKKIFIGLGFLFILAAALRIYHLGSADLWCDELNTKYRIQLSLPQIIEHLRYNPFPPLYYILMHYWAKLAGCGEFVLRLPSAIFSALTIIPAFFLAKELFGKKIAAYAAFLITISPFSIYYAQEAKMYSLLWLFGTLSFLFAYRFSLRYKTSDLLLYAMCALINIYTMYIGFIFMAAQNIYFLSLRQHRRKKDWLLAQLAIILLFLPWASMLAFHTINKIGTDWIPRVANYPLLILNIILPRIICGEIPQGRTLEAAIYLFLFIAAFIIKGKTAGKTTIDFKKPDYFLTLWIAAPIILYWISNESNFSMLYEHTERYAGFIYLPFFILIGKGISKFNAGIKRLLLIAILIVVFFYQIFPLYSYNYRVNRDNYKEFQKEISSRCDDNSLILTDLVIFSVGYFEKNCRIMPWSYAEEASKTGIDKNPSSILVIYRQTSPLNSAEFRKKLKDYKLVENYFKYPNGFLYFKNATL